MTEPNSDSEQLTLEVPPAEMQIRSWPMVDQPMLHAAIIVAYLIGACIAGSIADSLLMGVLCFIVLLLAVWRRWCPITWGLDYRGITQTIGSFRRKIAWQQLDSFQIHADGVILILVSSRGRPTFARPPIPFVSQRDELIAMIEYYHQQNGDQRSGSTRSAVTVE